MKRRLAVLLALTLTFASLSPAGAYAAEAEQPQEQVVEDVSVAEEAEEAADEEQEEVAPESEDSAQEATTVTIAAEEETEEEVAEDTVNEEDPQAEEQEQTEDAAAEGTTAEITEVAPEEEPAEVQEETTEITEAAGLIEGEIVESITEEVTKEAEAKVTNAFWRNPADGKRYYFNSNGVKLKNRWLHYTDGNTYYLGADGAAYEGFKKIDGKTYYFWDSRCKSKKPQGAMMTGWQLINGKRFFFADSRYPAFDEGVMLTGWRKIQGNMYFFANSAYPSLTTGTVVTGLRTINGRKFAPGSPPGDVVNALKRAVTNPQHLKALELLMSQDTGNALETFMMRMPIPKMTDPSKGVALHTAKGAEMVVGAPLQGSFYGMPLCCSTNTAFRLDISPDGKSAKLAYTDNGYLRLGISDTDGASMDKRAATYTITQEWTLDLSGDEPKLVEHHLGQTFDA